MSCDRSSKMLVESCHWDGYISSPSLLGDPSGFLSIQDVTPYQHVHLQVAAATLDRPSLHPALQHALPPMPSEHSLKQIFQVNVDSSLGTGVKKIYLFQSSHNQHGLLCFREPIHSCLIRNHVNTEASGQ